MAKLTDWLAPETWYIKENKPEATKKQWEEELENDSEVSFSVGDISTLVWHSFDVVPKEKEVYRVKCKSSNIIRYSYYDGKKWCLISPFENEASAPWYINWPSTDIPNGRYSGWAEL